MKNLIQFSAFFLLLLYVACKDKVGNYENCCGDLPIIDSTELTEPVIYFGDTIKRSRLYIPNVFAVKTGATEPGIDGYFMVAADSRSIVQITALIIRDDMDNLLFFGEQFPPNDPTFSWNGKLDDGSFYFGPFQYTIGVKYADGKVRHFAGRACAVECGADEFPEKNLPACFFPAQNDGQGGHDPNIPYADICF